MRITPPQRRRWTGWRRSSKPPFLLRFYYFSTPSEAPKCHDMRGIFRNAKCRKCLIFQAIPTFAKWCQDNQKIGRTFIIKIRFFLNSIIYTTGRAPAACLCTAAREQEKTAFWKNSPGINRCYILRLPVYFMKKTSGFSGTYALADWVTVFQKQQNSPAYCGC